MSLAEEAAAQVRAWLYDGTIGRDTFHSVPEVAQRLGMSRSPVREGLLGLAEAGLIEFVPKRGFRAVRPTGQDIAEIFALRLALEPVATADAARDGSADLLARLRRHLAAMCDAADRDDDVSFAAADEHLHATILDCAGNRRLTALIAGLRDTTRLIGASTADRSRSRADILAEHEPIVAAIAAADPGLAAREMRDHLLATGRLLIEQAQDDGDESAWESWAALIGEAPARHTVRQV
ncbi:GntR family transcriptional regulator [Flexivirga oryzae]|uniref:DNA-binding GntR family transcriptional regulator n=1 Tax=Flexivirga oryzae TaxID=1794944 RepID=A0A839N8A3_9MICO|nr:GntR family transcriptional regulator [Flexivirga oryzae]MBB2893998.1 DNA-binding GntR family transcriptional regulator [Flexivirga oryzae]